MTESPYRHIETPQEETFLQRMEQIFIGEKGLYASKFIATNSYGFGYITRKKEKVSGEKEQSNEETDTYNIVAEDGREPLTIEITKAPHGIFVIGFRGWKSAGKKIDQSEIENIINEIATSTELKPEIERISNDASKRHQRIRNILDHGKKVSYSTRANLTKDGILSLEKSQNRSDPVTIAELDLSGKNKRIRFSIEESGNIINIVTEKTEGFEQRPTLEIHIIHGGFSKRKELKPGTKEFEEAVKLLDENLETFKLPSTAHFQDLPANYNEDLTDWLKQI